jgi:hypothetical protein
LNRDINGDVDMTQKYLSMMKHLNRRREIVLLSDFNDFIEVSALKKILYRSNVHCFQILSPLDEAKTLPYSLFTSSRKNDRGNLGKYDLSGKKELSQEYGKRFKRLRVQEKYLDHFIKEMM